MKTFVSQEYILIAIANHFGLDRQNWNARINWASAGINEHGIDQFEFIYGNEAKEPMMFRKACQAYRDYIGNNSSGYVMFLDATASGLQILATLLGCHDTARNTNLLGGNRVDVYETVAKHMSTIVKQEISRDDLKKPLMTTFYGSKAQPKILFGEDTPELEAFYDVLNTELGGAVEAMNDIQSCWNPTVLAHQWTLPDGHTAYVPVMEAVDKKIEIDELDHRSFTHRSYVNTSSEYGISLAANVVHSLDGYIVREMYRRNGNQNNITMGDLVHYLLDKYNNRIEANAQMLPAQVITYKHLAEWTPDWLETLSYADHTYVLAVAQMYYSQPHVEILTIHDCFGARPKYMNIARSHYIRILAELAQSNVLELILSDITGQEMVVTKRSDDLGLKILLDAEYPLS